MEHYILSGMGILIPGNFYSLSHRQEGINTITMLEVDSAVNKLQRNKAPGLDKLPDLFREEPKIWIPYLCALFNAVLRGMELPDTWRGAEIVPIHKKGCPLAPTNYRPISLIDTTQKLFGRVILDRLQCWLEENQILSPYQAGFRSRQSTVDQIFRLQLIFWKTVTIEGGSLYVIFVDLKSAFDLVPRENLWKVMRDLGIPPYLLEIIMRLHEENYAQVRCGKHGTLSARFPVQKGVRQGCVLAPTLFCLFINGLIDHLNKISDTDTPKLTANRIPAMMFADDTLLLSKTSTGIQRILDGFANFCELRGLEINLTKTKFMILNPPKTTRPGPVLYGIILERVKIFDYLGVTLTENFGWKAQVDKAGLRLTQSVGGLLKFHRSSVQACRPCDGNL